MSSILAQFPTLAKLAATAPKTKTKPPVSAGSAAVKKTKDRAATAAIEAALASKFSGIKANSGKKTGAVKRKAAVLEYEVNAEEPPMSEFGVAPTKVPVAWEERCESGLVSDEENNDEFDDDTDLMALAADGSAADEKEDAELDALFAHLKGNFAAKGGDAVSLIVAGKKRKKVRKEAVNSADAVVVGFDPTVGKREARAGGARERRAFMTSDVSKLTAEPKPKAPVTEEEEKQEKEDDANDRDLMDLLKSSRLLEDFAASELTGKDRRKHLEQKLIDLGAKKLSNPKAPFPMRLGMQRAQEERQEKRVKTAKEMGLYHSSLRTQIMAGNDKEMAKKLAAGKKKKSGVKKGEVREIDAGVGRFKDGTLHIGKKADQVVAKMGGGVSKKGVRGKGRSVGMGIKITGMASDGAKKKIGKKFKKKR
ncbi:hypothetical protein BC830DRAFT_1103582 [Chytriomyces sp. MP71]|nr:hypothetical protein BC830DRAFT_1103582 [Chytriomyces sp. MP71]